MGRLRRIEGQLAVFDGGTECLDQCQMRVVDGLVRQGAALLVSFRAAPPITDGLVRGANVGAGQGLKGSGADVGEKAPDGECV